MCRNDVRDLSPERGVCMEDKTSIRGKTARRVVKVAHRLPYLAKIAQDETLRDKLTERERPWKCPADQERIVIELEHSVMEFLGPKEGEVPGLILQLHGGGYYGKLRNVYRHMAEMYYEISEGYGVLSLDYRVAPEHPYPAALDDALDAYRWIMEQGYPPEQTVVVGDSAGGGLALALVMYLRDHGMPLPGGIITMSAWTDLTGSGPSYKDNYEIDPIFGKSTKTLIYKKGYLRDEDPCNPYISPAFGDFTGFPPMLLQVGEYEMLLSDTETVAKKAKKAGVRVRKHVYKGMFHVFQMGLSLYPESQAAWEEVGKFFKKYR